MSSDNVCRNCRFWGEDLNFDAWRDCRFDLPLIAGHEDWKSCHAMACDGLQVVPGRLAMAYETGEVITQVLTSPDFGCRMFEAVPETSG